MHGNGVIYHFDGTGWSQVVNQTNIDVWGIDVLAGNAIVAVGFSGSYRFFDGTRWLDLGRMAPNALRDVWSGGTNTAIAIGEAGAVLRFTP